MYARLPNQMYLTRARLEGARQVFNFEQLLLVEFAESRRYCTMQAWRTATARQKPRRRRQLRVRRVPAAAAQALVYRDADSFRLRLAPDRLKCKDLNLSL